MFSTILTVITHLVAAGAGAYVWPKLSPLWGKWSASRAVKAAKAAADKAVTDAHSLLAQEEARVAALAKAKATVAAATTTPTGPTGATGPSH